MPLPPDQLPDGLSAPEYKRLAGLYGLMGRVELSVQAMVRAEGIPPMGSAEAPSDEDSSQVQDAALAFALNMLKAFGQTVAAQIGVQAVDVAANPASQPDPFAEMRGQLVLSGVPEVGAQELVENLGRALREKPDTPTREIPRGLTASEYYELGLKYKEVGWTEQAREALQYAIELDPNGASGRKALSFLSSKVPRVSVPLVAEQRNILGFNQSIAGDIQGARQTFEGLIREYPAFEWPCGNLGSLLIHIGDLGRAKTVLDRAVDINPHYVNAWLHLARLHALNDDFGAAYHCLDRAAEIDPQETGIASTRQAIDAVAVASQ